MSSQFRCVAGITARFITVVMKGAWWERAGIDPTVTARALWLKTHPLPAHTGS
jgi:hypothetical protein